MPDGSDNNPKKQINTPEIMKDVNAAAQRLVDAAHNKDGDINKVLKDIKDNIKAHKDEEYGLLSYDRAFVDMLNEKLMRDGTLPELLLNFSENDPELGNKLKHGHIEDKDLDKKQSESQKAGDLLQSKLAEDIKGYEYLADGLVTERNFWGQNHKGIDKKRLEALVDHKAALNVIEKFIGPDPRNPNNLRNFNILAGSPILPDGRLGANKGYVTKEDIGRALDQTKATNLPVDQVAALQYMKDNFHKLAMRVPGIPEECVTIGSLLKLENNEHITSRELNADLYVKNDYDRRMPPEVYGNAALTGGPQRRLLHSEGGDGSAKNDRGDRGDMAAHPDGTTDFGSRSELWTSPKGVQAQITVDGRGRLTHLEDGAKRKFDIVYSGVDSKSVHQFKITGPNGEVQNFTNVGQDIWKKSGDEQLVHFKLETVLHKTDKENQDIGAAIATTDENGNSVIHFADGKTSKQNKDGSFVGIDRYGHVRECTDVNGRTIALNKYDSTGQPQEVSFSRNGHTDTWSRDDDKWSLDGTGKRLFGKISADENGNYIIEEHPTADSLIKHIVLHLDGSKDVTLNGITHHYVSEQEQGEFHYKRQAANFADGTSISMKHPFAAAVNFDVADGITKTASLRLMKEGASLAVKEDNEIGPYATITLSEDANTIKPLEDGKVVYSSRSSEDASSVADTLPATERATMERFKQLNPAAQGVVVIRTDEGRYEYYGGLAEANIVAGETVNTTTFLGRAADTKTFNFAVRAGVSREHPGTVAVRIVAAPGQALAKDDQTTPETTDKTAGKDVTTVGKEAMAAGETAIATGKEATQTATQTTDLHKAVGAKNESVDSFVTVTVDKDAPAVVPKEFGGTVVYSSLDNRTDTLSANEHTLIEHFQQLNAQATDKGIVVIRMKDGRYECYAGLAGVNVRAGKSVDPFTLIGTVGSSHTYKYNVRKGDMVSAPAKDQSDPGTNTPIAPQADGKG